MKIDRGRPIRAQLNLAINVQFCIFELRVPGHLQIGALGYGLQYIVAHPFVIKSQIAQMDVCIDHRLL